MRVSVSTIHKLDFRRFLESSLRVSPGRDRGRSAGSFPEQRLVIEPIQFTGPDKRLLIMKGTDKELKWASNLDRGRELRSVCTYDRGFSFYFPSIYVDT